jgi:DNA-binding NarL/FixJ family response regulator
MERPRRILIANADQAARAQLRAAARAAGLRICGYAKDATEAVAKVRRTRPDICLLDLDLPGGGLQAAGEIGEERPETSVVVLSRFGYCGPAWIEDTAPASDDELPLAS